MASENRFKPNSDSGDLTKPFKGFWKYLGCCLLIMLGLTFATPGWVSTWTSPLGLSVIVLALLLYAWVKNKYLSE